MLGYAQARTGQPGTGMPLLREALEHSAQGRRTTLDGALHRLPVAEALLLTHPVVEAATLGERALVLSAGATRNAGPRPGPRYAAGRDPRERSGRRMGLRPSGHYHDAIALAGDLGMRAARRPGATWASVSFGRTGGRGPGAASSTLPPRRPMFREMGMSWWLERADTEREQPERGEDRGGATGAAGDGAFAPVRPRAELGETSSPGRLQEGPPDHAILIVTGREDLHASTHDQGGDPAG